MVDEIELWALYRIQGDTEREMTRDGELGKLEESCAYMNANAPNGVRYEVRGVQMSTRPFKARDKQWLQKLG